MECRFVDSIAQIDADLWNSVVGDTYPFMQHDFLRALELGECVNVNTGWKPCHLMVTSGDSVLAVMPLYLKFHSYGEYVFDFAWARAYEAYGVQYYPKLLSAIPFVPASGVRLACLPSVDKHALFSIVAESLSRLAQQQNISSIHILLASESEAVNWSRYGFNRKIGTQFHWLNNDYRHFDHFLESFNSRKRKAVKKERAAISQQGLIIEVRIGKDISAELWDIFFNFYRDTYQKRSGHNGYLTRHFFSCLSDSILAQTMIIFAKRGSDYVAGALYFFSDTTLYGRHWGCKEDIEMLHFELCYYAGIEFCINRGLKKFEAGAQGEHKIQRGFVPSEVYSNHWVLDSRFQPAIKANILEESKANLLYIEEMKQFLPYKNQ